MASAATEPASRTYHVFINHRGPDVKRTLASFIYHRLTNCHGLRVFLDENELHTGDALSPAILGAIESASVHIAIFSKRYAESRWCLDELCWILRCNRKIIPVFYDVEPTDLRYIDNERGCYRKAFEEHQLKGRVGMEDIEKWKTALNKASEISGLLFKTSESDHGQVLEEIVKAVLKGVEWEPFELPTYLVGLDPAVKEIEDEIKKQTELNSTAVVGIAGMAGVGKSTLATYLYNLKRSDFSRSCFLSEIKNRKKDLPSLQRKLLRDLLGCDFHIEDTRQGKGIFRKRLSGLQVLIVLDDVDHIDQISSLLMTDVVGSRSLILITSRDQDLLRRSSPKSVVYDVKPLQIKHAQELFCRHAFHQSVPDEGFECLVEEVLKICGGLPLSLRVLGEQFLVRREEEYWKRQLQKLSRRLPEDIVDTLKVSYEALNAEEKEIFLDVGCFFFREDKELAVRVLEGLGYRDVCDCLENLRQKCLLEYQDDLQSDNEEKIDVWHDPDGNYDYLYLPKTQKIAMHEHIRQLARHIAREEFGVLPSLKPLRLSCSDDIEESMLKLQGGAHSLIRGIRTPKGENLPDCTNYIKAVGVRIFVVEIPTDLSSPFGLWNVSGDLVWLRLRSFRSINFPETISLGNLRVLELEGPGDIDQFFQRFNMQPPLRLSVLNIDLNGSHGMPRLPKRDRMPQLPKGVRTRRLLKKVDSEVNACSTSGLYPETSDSVQQGFTAPYFEVISDSVQESFTEPYFFHFLEWIGTSIKFLDKIVLKNITSLEFFPGGFGELKGLRHLDLSGCTFLTQLPEAFSELTHLHFLVLRHCHNLSIPLDILGNISSLEYVDFEGCGKLQYLPAGMANQRSLRYLNLLSTDLKWPLNVKLPEELQRLRIGNLPGEVKSNADSPHIWESYSLPGVNAEDILGVNAEVEVVYYEDSELNSIADSEVEVVYYEDSELNSIAEFYNSHDVNAKYINAIDYAEDAYCEDSELNLIADSLNIWESDEHKRCQQRYSGNLQSTFDTMNASSKFCSMELIGKHVQGTQVEQVEGTKLRQSLGDLRQLKELLLIDFSGADGILWEEIAGPNMKVLVIRNCPIYILNFKVQETMHVAMGALIDFTLTKTRISEICIPEGVLPSLETLDLSENSRLMQVKYLPSTLVRLNLQRCHQLKELVNLSNLVNLKFLCINDCKELETLKVEGLTSLEEIQAEECIKLKSIHGLSQLEGLKYIRISTDTDVMWNHICSFLTSTSHEKLSTAFFTGKSRITYSDTEMVMQEMRSIIMGQFNLKVVDVVFPAPVAPVNFFSVIPLDFNTKMEDLQSYGGILMCFLTGTDEGDTLDPHRGEVDVFRVRFEGSNDEGSAEEYEFRVGETEGGVKVHVLMWREECDVFRDEKGYNSITVSCQPTLLARSVDVKKGWILMIHKHMDVSQVCKQIISALSLC